MINIKQGSFYIVDPDGTKHELPKNIPSVEDPMEINLPEAITELDFNEDPCFTPLMQFTSPASFTATLHVTKEQYTRMIDTFLGLFKAICELCPNKRVIHLAMYGRKPRTRKKNRKRAIRILEGGD